MKKILMFRLFNYLLWVVDGLGLTGKLVTMSPATADPIYTFDPNTPHADTGMAFDKIVIDLGELKMSYLGPEETRIR